MNEVLGIFPVPLQRSTYLNDLTSDELDTVREYLSDLVENKGNLSSSSHTVLDDHRLENIRNFIEEAVDEYFKKIICTSNNLKPYITLSWLNLNRSGQYHHRHYHANSILSGTFYISADKRFDKIYFHKEEKSGIIEFITKDFNLYNSSTWWIEVDKNTLLIWPSHLSHSVDINNQNYDRISLSFNVFVKGEIGCTQDLNYLKIKDD